MNERSHLIARMARREMSQIAQARRDLAKMLVELRSAEALLSRLHGLLEHKREQASLAASVAQLREGRHLTDQLSVEAEKTRLRVEKLREDSNEAAEALARLDHRKRTFDEAAKTARIAERTERENRAEALIPQRQPR